MDVDEDALAELEAYFDRLADAEGLSPGQPRGFDAAYLRHQIPGGVVTTMRRHLKEHRASHLEDAVIEEFDHVREELGWPIVMTPFAQILVTQATMNVMGKERYAMMPDELIRYALGKFGRPNVPIDANVMDKIQSLTRTKELLAESGPASVDELRARVGKDLSDEEFLLRATMPGGQVDAMRAVDPSELHYDPDRAPVMDLIRKLVARRDVASVRVDKPGFSLALDGGRPAFQEA